MRFTQNFKNSFTGLGFNKFEYDGGLIYKITSKIGGNIYYGSTINLPHRIKQHVNKELIH